MMMVGVLGVLYFLGIKDQPGAFWGFFAMFLLLFFATGVGNASTFQMIPSIMRKEMDRLMPRLTPPTRLRQAEKESAAIIGFTSAIAAFGAFFIPKAYGTSIDLTGGVAGGAVGLPRLLRDLRRGHLGRLHAQRRPAARHRARPRRHFARRRSLPNQGDQDHEPFPRSPDVLHARQGANSPTATAS